MVETVFICYAREDEDFVLKLATNLKHEGVPVWIDQWDIPTGANYPRSIEKALKACTHLLLVLSPSSVESDDVQSEWLSVLNDGKIVVPILYQTCNIPYRLKSIQYADFTSRDPNDRSALKQILRDLGLPHAQGKRVTEEHTVENVEIPHMDELVPNEDVKIPHMAQARKNIDLQILKALPMSGPSYTRVFEAFEQLGIEEEELGDRL